ncbi:hypothetical protein [Scleromatobacter humisilvae]|uniref:Uncharacterized protein n=1 Tax=Scleromatobacter humisilvae TaxID=2897159 RepID=A0A9X2C3E3_9BURK|nr:hypothetical protein [Scleromatobacter humisilvae]MCK9687335.1 hypothetical protein [Scleromatobacter humisilvae]
MPIHSTPFGRTVITGEDAKAFMRTLKQGRGNKAAAESAANGRKLVAEFAARGSVTIKLRDGNGTRIPD